MGRDPTPIAKVTRPVLRNAFPRNRLFRLLDRARKRPIVWISAPAGSGKTTLVGSYLSAREIPFLWYQVDQSDKDIASFFYYMGLAAQRAAPRRREPLPRLTPEHLPGLSTFTRRFFEKLFGRVRPGTVVVLDDYQKVPAESTFHEVIRDGLSHLPEGINALVISRNDPPPAFSRERVHGQMEVVGWQDLRLTPEETKGIARQRGGGRRSAEAFRHLHGRSGGWVAGLVLLLEKTSGETPELRPVSDRAPEEVFEYFAGEVFEGFEEEAQSFLLSSAFLPKMTASMAEAITGNRRAGSTLSYLNRNNYFTELHRNPEPIYAYHPLFRDFLLSRARDVFSARHLHRIRTRAAAILDEAGHDEDAAALYRELGDWEEVARILLRQAPRLLRHGRTGTLAEWIALLPPKKCEEDSWIRYWRGVCRLPSRPDESLRDFEEAFRRFRMRKDAEGALAALSGAMDAIVYGAGSLKMLDPWFRTLVELLESGTAFPSRDAEIQVTGTVIKALALRRPAFIDKEKWADRAEALAQTTRDIPLKFSFLLNVAYYRFHGGEFQALGLLIDSLRGMVRGPEISPLARLTLCWLEAAYANMKGMHDRCLRAVKDGIELADATGLHLMDLLLKGHGALSSLHRGDVAAARGILEEMAASLPEARPWAVCFYHHVAGWEALGRGDLAGANFHSDHCLAMCEEVGNPWTEAMGELQGAFVFHRRGEADEASRRLERAFRIGEAGGMQFVRFACLLTAAYFAFLRGDETAGIASLREGLRVGKEKGYVDTYLWSPGLLERIAGEALVKGIEKDYVRELVGKNALVPEGAFQAIEQWPWPLKIYTLGRFDVQRDDKPLPVSRKAQRKPLLLLKALISLGGKDVPEERITDALWPEAEGDLAHQSFSMALSRLRRLLGDDKALQLREGRLTLDTRYCWVDASSFESLLARFDDAHGGRECPDDPRVTRLAFHAIALYKGPFLAGETSDPWIAAPRERLRSKFLRAVEFIGSCLEREERHAEAIDCYRKGLEVDDLAEGFYQRLMVCHRRLGQAAEALVVYDRCRKVLSAVLGIPPSPETQAIAKTLR